MADPENLESKFQPYVSAEDIRPELSVRAIFLGCMFGLIFGAVTVYVGLRAGLTVAASIPIAVLSISILRAFGKASILENNIVQTTGSAGESVAGGVIFTLPALIIMGFPLEYIRTFMLALIGGWLGVFFMIPLRRQLIVKEHGNLLYPEGTACADVLIAGDKGGSFASRVFMGLGLGSLYTLFQNENLFGLWPSTPDYQPKWYPGSAIRANTTTEYLGVGYIIGPRIAGVIFAGGVFAWLVVMPAIKFFGGFLTSPLYPAQKLIANMSVGEIYVAYIRPMGAGAVAAAGLITLIKTVPTIVNALRAGASDLKKGAAAALGARRTDMDLSIKHALVGTLLMLITMVAYLAIKPVPGTSPSIIANIAAAVFVVVFGFLFVTVSSRITGLIGTSSNPISGMAIATMMATCVMFLLAGWTTNAYKALVIAIGGVVCIASANAGNTSQDLKTGFLVGATPKRQQIALLIGVLVSVFAIGGTLGLMNQGLEQVRPVGPIAIDLNDLEQGVREVTPGDNPLLQRASIKVVDEKGNTLAQEDPRKFRLLTALGAKKLANGQYLYNAATGSIERQWIQGIGSDKAPAPQANLMATVVTGIIDHRLPWNLVLIGVFIVIGIELLGIRSLSFAVGFYISIATTLAIFCGGIVRWLVDRAASKRGEGKDESDVSPGSLYASGLIAAGGIVGLLGIFIKLLENAPDSSWYHIREGLLLLGPRLPAIGQSNIISVIMFALLAASLFYFARKPIAKEK
ncbi:MAG TPA: oligopeptide transporter, OPT family [Candidatus Saccharimonadales bacterium]|nr:oligopeptide transporter, OPT family [Candidatus Saccharimonadales bacterium]